ncbi:MAG: ribonuclease D [Candidatus Competibacter denitrificans]
MNPLYIVDQAALSDFCQQIHAVPWIALDTEFIREQTYYPQLCLIQIAIPSQIACIDALALPSLEPLLERLYDPTILKILHAGHQDLEIFFHLRGSVPSPIFDTQLAALVLGCGSQLGYANLVQQILGIDLAKAHTRADWRQRPLPTAWLAYAADDVHYLGEIYTRQRTALDARGWLSALAEDFQALSYPDRYQPQPQQEWRRIREQNRLRGPGRAVLRALAAWREDQARQHDRPRRWILDDSVLVELARRLPDTQDALQQIRGLPGTTCRRHGAALLELIASARQEPPECWPDHTRRPTFSQQGALQAAKLLQWIETRASHYGIDPRDIADQRDIECLLTGQDSRLLHGWRAALIGNELAEHLASPAKP